MRIRSSNTSLLAAHAGMEPFRRGIADGFKIKVKTKMALEKVKLRWCFLSLRHAE